MMTMSPNLRNISHYEKPGLNLKNTLTTQKNLKINYIEMI